MAEHDANGGTAPIGKAFLVTGATGKTGRHTVPLLLGRGHRVRALVHRLDGRSEALAALGAEVVAGDLLDHNAVGRALAGIDAAYFCYPIEPGLLEATAVFAQAAREAGVGAIVNMSQIFGNQVSWWQGWWWRLETMAGAIDYTPTDYLIDRLTLLEGGMQEMRAELDALKAPGVEP